MISFIKEKQIYTELYTYVHDILRESQWVEDIVLVFMFVSIGFLVWNLIKVLLFFHKLLFRPFNRIKPLEEVGYVNFENLKLNQEQIMQRARRRRKIDVELPPVYPNCWYRVMESSSLKQGEVKQCRLVGENLVIFRNQSGVVSLMDTYCPHMGANIAVGGRVLGDCVQCPFHGWKFDVNGKCVDIPYSKTKLDFIPKLKTWIIREVNGHIMTWYHVDGKSPQWEIPVARGLSKMKCCGRSEHRINCHFENLPENAYDEAHLQHLHSPFFMSGANLRTQFESWFSIIKQKMTTDYVDFNEQKHATQIHVKHEYCLWNKFNFLPVDITISQIGPAAVQIYIKFAFGEVILMNYITPTDKFDIIMVHDLHVPLYMPMWFGKCLLYGFCMQVERDIMIWNNRSYLQNPIMLKEETIQKKFKKWMAQFYSPTSVRYNQDGEKNA